LYLSIIFSLHVLILPIQKYTFHCIPIIWKCHTNCTYNICSCRSTDSDINQSVWVYSQANRFRPSIAQWARVLLRKILEQIQITNWGTVQKETNIWSASKNGFQDWKWRTHYTFCRACLRGRTDFFYFSFISSFCILSITQSNIHQVATYTLDIVFSISYFTAWAILLLHCSLVWCSCQLIPRILHGGN